MKISNIISISILGLSMSLANAGEKSHWGYEGQTGPEHWAEIDPAFGLCGTGANQSPVNLDHFIDAELQEIKFDYRSNASDFINNGHTVQVNFDNGSSIAIDDKVFELKQFHFHTPGENLIGDKSFPMEAHLVHASRDGQLAVIGIMFEEGKENPLLKKLLSVMPERSGDKHPVTTLNALEMLPESKDYYRYNGSLTTPPCTEGVHWLVMKNSVMASAEQLNAFSGILHKNNRPVQPEKARPILE